MHNTLGLLVIERNDVKSSYITGIKIQDNSGEEVALNGRTWPLIRLNSSESR